MRLAGGDEATMKLAEWGAQLSGSGHQTSIPSTDYPAGYTRRAVSMFARWSQEN